MPGIVAGQVDVLPPDGREVGEGFIFDGDTMVAQGGDRAFQVHRVPEDDGRNDQVEPACAVTLVLEASVAQVALPVEEDGTSEGVPGLALVEANLDTSAQLRVLHPLQHEERALDAADFAKRRVEAILSGITCKFSNDERGGHCPVPVVLRGQHGIQRCRASPGCIGAYVGSHSR